MKDALGNDLKIGDTIAYAGRYVGQRAAVVKGFGQCKYYWASAPRETLKVTNPNYKPGEKSRWGGPVPSIVTLFNARNIVKIKDAE